MQQEMIEALDPQPGETWIDIANADGPTPEILTRLRGVRAYRQDLIYPEGIHGDRIGGDAGAMPVADGFADAMSLHCSLEHFEGDADRLMVGLLRDLYQGNVDAKEVVVLKDIYELLERRKSTMRRA